MSRAPVVRGLALAALVLGLPGPARADQTFRSSEWGVEVTVPRGWELSEQRSYPGVLARAFEHKSGSHLILAVERVAAGETARSYVEKNQQGLRKLGYRITGVSGREGGAVILDAVTPDRKRSVRQATFVEGGIAYILTVAVKIEAVKTSRPFEAFDEAIRTLNLSPPPPPPTPDAGSTAPPDPGEAAPASQPAETPQ